MTFKKQVMSYFFKKYFGVLSKKTIFAIRISIQNIHILKNTQIKNRHMKPTLFLLAAGMGSRYGGLKQLDGLGPNGESLGNPQRLRRPVQKSNSFKISGQDSLRALLPEHRRTSRRVQMSGRPPETLGNQPRRTHGQGRDKGTVLCDQLR